MFKKKFNKDYLPAEHYNYEYIIDVLKEISYLYNFKLINISNWQPKLKLKDFKNKQFCVEGLDEEKNCLQVSTTISLLNLITENRLYLDPLLPLKFSFVEPIFVVNQETKVDYDLEFGYEIFGKSNIYVYLELIYIVNHIFKLIGITQSRVIVKNIKFDEFNNFTNLLMKNNINYFVNNTIASTSLSSQMYIQIEVNYNNKYYKVAHIEGHNEIINNFYQKNYGSVGLTINVDSLTTLSERLQLIPNLMNEADFLIFATSESLVDEAFEISENLRNKLFMVESIFVPMNPDKGIKLAQSKKIGEVIFLEENFINSGIINYINLRTYLNKQVGIEEFLKDILSRELGEEDEKNTQ